MDGDDKVILAEAASVEFNTDETDISRTVEDELFSAIYHSADHVFDSPESPDANNSSLKDNTDSSKNIHPNPDARLQTNITSRSGIGVIQSHESFGGRESFVRNVLPLNDWKESLSDISQSDKVSTSVSQSNKPVNEVVDTYREVISNTDLYNSEENLSAFPTHQPDGCHTKNVRQQRRNRENKFVRGYKPKNWWSSDESIHSTDCVTHDGGISLLENGCYEKESKDISDAADYKQLETWLTLSEASSCSQTTSSDESASIKPEERCENHQPMTNKSVCMMAHKPPRSTAHKQSKQSTGISNEDLVLLSDFSCPDSLIGESSQSSTKSRNTEIISRKNDDRPPSMSKSFSSVISLDDSEDSIFEVPVPPKPAPPTIDLEDSESPPSFHDETSSNISPEKLVETYRIALAKSMHDQTKPDAEPRNHREKKSTNQKKTRPSPRTRSPDNPTSDGNNDVTLIPYTSQAIATQSLIEQDTPTQVLSSNDRLSQVICNANDQLSSICTIDKDADIDNARFMRDSPMSPDQTSENATSEVPVVTEQQRLETASEVPLRKNRLTENATELSPDTLIINATEVQSPQGSTKAKDKGQTKSLKSLESKKRSVVDVEKRSKGPSPKKTKTSNESAVSGSSRVIPSNESGTREGNPQSRALDDFFQPMTEEMINYYNESWGRENFDLDAIRRNMPKDPQYWTLSNEDLLAHQNRRRYWSHLKCKNCKRQGHRMSECSEERKLPACYMCGVRGHHKLSCPHTMCLGCGTKQVTYTEYCTRCKTARCTICQSIGHSADICPDLWRRYHHITSEENLKTQQDPSLVMKPRKQLSCCNCARRGHDSTTCKDYRWSKYSPTPAYVTNYTSGPAYAQDMILENVDSTIRTQKRGVTEEAEDEGFVADNEDSPSKRKRAKKNKTSDKTLEEDGNSETPVQSTDENTSKIKERGKDQENTRSETGEFFIVQSPEFTHEKTKDFCPSEYNLTAPDYAVYSNSDRPMKFLDLLVREYLAKLDFRHYTNGTYVLIITAAPGMGAALVQTIKDFAQWRPNERNRFMSRVIPKKRVRLIKSLTAKLLEIEQDLGKPSELYKTLLSLKNRLRSIDLNRKAGVKCKSHVKRIKTVDQLARLQCRLNMILQKEGESHQYLKTALTDLKNIQDENVPCQQYLTIVHHYNKVFAAYTPNNLKGLIDQYMKDQRTKGINFHDSQNKNARRLNSPRMRGNNGVHKNTAAPAQSLAIPLDNQVEIPTATFNNINRNMNRNQPLNPYEPMHDYINPESEYYQTHPSFRLHPQNSGNRYQDGLQENHWEGFARHTLANNPDNFQPEFNRYHDYRTPMPRSKDQNIQRNAEYRFADDISLNNIPSNIPFVDSHTIHTVQNTSPNKILFRGRQAGSSQEFYVGIDNTLPANKVDSRAQNNRKNKSAKAKRAMLTKREKQIREERRKARKEKHNTLPFLRKRAEKNIVKYKKEVNRLGIGKAMKRLQKQIDDNSLTMKKVRKFENLAKREMKLHVKKKSDLKEAAATFPRA
ncbi:uncharacterized protein LOC105693595 isoform X1 [Athalia rosae]|uniref:uncharacterized protein LOC105693595 isoform X1 n=1 Tax=Athalia rosae TaxID=37344 RepID=UPI0020343132|nr:uncharacterized protein LOC105693595 isoform X1 [Athalia rosae]